MSFYRKLISNIRGIRYSSVSNRLNKMYSFGGIYLGHYQRFKHDPTPLAFCMYSDSKYTHSLNCHYLSEPDKAWLARSLFMIKKYGQVIDGRVFYKYLKLHRYSIIQSSYRIYLTQFTDFKLVAPGLTYLDKLVYPSNERFVKQLNEVMSKEAISGLPTTVSLSTTELRERIIETTNAIPIQKMPNKPSTGSFGRASWLKG